MPEFGVEIETDSDDYITNVKPKLEAYALLDGLKDYTKPSDLNKYQPINDARVGPLLGGVSGQKPYWLFAEIYPHHLGKGESTDKNRDLAKEIRNRGKDGDDCGHIIAASLGGKMVYFNLFPQNKKINRGWNGWNQHWRIGIEVAIYLWLKNSLVRNPRVEFEVRLFYNENEFPDRPERGSFSITFKHDGPKSTKTTNDHDQGKSSMPSYAQLRGGLMNIINDELDSVPEPNYDKINWNQYSQFHHLDVEEFQKLVEHYLQEWMEASKSEQSSGQKPNLLNRPIRP